MLPIVLAHWLMTPHPAPEPDTFIGPRQPPIIELTFNYPTNMPVMDHWDIQRSLDGCQSWQVIIHDSPVPVPTWTETNSIALYRTHGYLDPALEALRAQIARKANDTFAEYLIFGHVSK